MVCPIPFQEGEPLLSALELTERDGERLVHAGTERDTLTAEIKNGSYFSQSQSDP